MKVSKPNRMIAQCPPPPLEEMNISPTVLKIPWKLIFSSSALFLMKIKVIVKHFVNFLILTNLISLTYLVTLRPFTLL